MPTKTVYLITGANRGLGLQLVTDLSALPDTVVYGGVRNVEQATELLALSKELPNVVRVVKLISASEEDSQAVVEEIARREGRLDCVIANAAYFKKTGDLSVIPIQDFRDHFEVNTIGPVVLWQAAAPLLLKSPAPKFAIISAVAGSIGDHFPMQAAAYGSSKAAANFMVKTLHAENENLIAMAIHPGWFQSEMGNRGARSIGLEGAPVTIEDSSKGVLSHILGATRETKSGKFLNFAKLDSGNPWDYNTEEVPW